MNYMLQIKQDDQWVNKQKFTDIWDYRTLHNRMVDRMHNAVQTTSMGMVRPADIEWRLKRLPDFLESEA